MEKMDNRRKWQLHWREPMEPYPCLRHEPGDEAEPWVGSDSAEAIKSYAAAKGWDPTKVVRIVLNGSDGAGNAVHTTVADVAAWDTAAETLPKALVGYEPPRSPRAHRMDFLRAVRRAVDVAVAAHAIDGQDAAGLLLHAADVAERALDRSRKSAAQQHGTK